MENLIYQKNTKRTPITNITNKKNDMEVNGRVPRISGCATSRVGM
jgi:hypothetical protein